MGRRFLILFLMLSCVGISERAGAAIEQNGFLNIAGGAIKGNATVSGYENQIVVQSVSYGVHQGGEWEEGVQLTGRVTTLKNIVVTKVMDNGSPALAHACAIKAQFPKVELNLVAGTDSYLTVTLEKVIIRDVQVDYTTGDTRPMEKVILSYQKATWRYGTATTSYNLQTNSGGAQIQQQQRLRNPRQGMRRPQQPMKRR